MGGLRFQSRPAIRQIDYLAIYGLTIPSTGGPGQVRRPVQPPD